MSNDQATHTDHGHTYECKACWWHSHRMTAVGFLSEKQQAAEHTRIKGHAIRETKTGGSTRR